MTALELLIAARERVAKGWTQGRSAETKGGRYAHYSDKGAAKFCAWGGLHAACPLTEGLSLVDAAEAELERSLPKKLVAGAVSGDYRPLARWNDMPGRTKKQVLALFDKTIARLQESA
jgi:hypothetical protein